MTCHILPDTTTLTVLSLNCWGIRWVAKDYKARMRAIRETLFQDCKHDVICFQEIWNVSDFERFQEEAERRGVFPYSHYFYSGVFGSGVCVFSQWPIEEMLFYKWQLNGYIHKITHADWYGGKGIGLCTLNVKGKKVNIYTCHTHAEYSKEPEYLAHRVVQAFDIAQFIRLTSQNADFAVLAADLNSEPEDLCFKIIVEYAGLNDSFEREGVDFEGTYGCSRNTYSGCMSPKKPQGERIDHILYKCGTHMKVECSGYCNPLKPTVPKSHHSYSDHEAIAATFILHNKSTPSNNYEENNNEKNYQNSLEEAYQICTESAEKLRRDIKWCLRIGFLTAILFVLSAVIISCFFTRAQLRYNFLIMSVVTFIITLLSLCVLIWKRIELHGILCAAHGMKLPLKIKLNRAAVGDKKM